MFTVWIYLCGVQKIEFSILCFFVIYYDFLKIQSKYFKKKKPKPLAL
jgi:hypothetical protein